MFLFLLGDSDGSGNRLISKQQDLTSRKEPAVATVACCSSGSARPTDVQQPIGTTFNLEHSIFVLTLKYYGDQQQHHLKFRPLSHMPNNTRVLGADFCFGVARTLSRPVFKV